MPKQSGRKRTKQGDFPGGPVVKTPCFHFRGHELDPWSGNYDLTCHVVQPRKKKPGGITLPDFRQYYKATVIKWCGIGTKTDRWINGTE